MCSDRRGGVPEEGARPLLQASAASANKVTPTDRSPLARIPPCGLHRTLGAFPSGPSLMLRDPAPKGKVRKSVRRQPTVVCRPSQRSPIGSGFFGSGPTYSDCGRISRLSDTCSSTCAVQPAEREAAKVGGKRSLGRPTDCSTPAE